MSVIQNLINDLAGTTTIPDLKHRDFLSIPAFFPRNKEEQSKIVDKISEMEEHLTIDRNDLAKLEYIKKGLMQDLLTGKVRVTPLIEA